MLPTTIRENLFDRYSVKTMRFVRSVPRHAATGLVKRIYQMVSEDFFINGSITSQSKVPEIMAGMWTGGREILLVSDRLDRTTKEAMSGILSNINDCAYCADMLVSLVYGSGKKQAAAQVFESAEDAIRDPVLRGRCAWIRQIVDPKAVTPVPTPFTPDELPEAIGTVFAFSYINRFSHVTMDGSPVQAPFGARNVKAAALRLFGIELKTTTERKLEPGRALELLPAAPLPVDMNWAASNPRIAAALSRWAAAVEREIPKAVSPKLRHFLEQKLQAWHGEAVPLSRSWVNEEVAGLSGEEADIARFALVVAKAPFQIDETLVEAVLQHDRSEERLIRILAWAAFTTARRIAGLCEQRIGGRA